MDVNQILQNSAETIQKSSDEATSNLDTKSIVDALEKLLSSENGGFDIGNIISKVQDGNWSDIIGSWLGNGENKPISADSISDLFNSEKISEFASSLGISEESAKKALSEVMPQFMDTISIVRNS